MYLTNSKKGTHWLRTFPFTKGKAQCELRASKYRLKLLIHTSFLIQICWHICYWINIFNGCLQPPPNTSPPHPQFFVSRWQTCLKFLATIFVNERQRDWVNFTHQRGLPIFSGTMGCWIFSIFTRFNMFLRFYQLSKPMILTSSMYLTPLGKNPLSAIYLPFRSGYKYL